MRGSFRKILNNELACYLLYPYYSNLFILLRASRVGHSFLSSSAEIIIHEICIGVCQDGGDIRLYLWEFSTFRSFGILCVHVHRISVRDFE